MAKEIHVKATDFRTTFPQPRYSVRDFDPDGQRSERREIHLFCVLDALWKSDCKDVHKMCIRSLEEELYPRESYEALLSNARHLVDNHKLAQDTVVTLIVEGEEKLASKVLCLYIEHALDAASKDYLSFWGEDEERENLLSCTYARKAVDFGLRLLLAKAPRQLSRGAKNYLYMRSDLAKFFLGLVREGKLTERHSTLFLRLYPRNLLANLMFIKEIGLVLKEDQWPAYERVFSYAVRRPLSFDRRGLGYVITIATMLLDMSFEEDEFFGPLFKNRVHSISNRIIGLKGTYLN